MLAWMDLEMTGLNPDRHTIVEIATIVTDDELRVVATGPDVVIHATAQQLDQMDDYVRAMHARSGLLSAIQASTVTVEDAGKSTLEFLRSQLPEPHAVPLAGNSIGTDRRFLARQLPEIEHYLHYRSVDVSTVKELCRRWFPEAMASAPPKRTTHRALDDINESIVELRYYRETIFRGVDDARAAAATETTGTPATNRAAPTASPSAPSHRPDSP